MQNKEFIQEFNLNTGEVQYLKPQRIYQNS